MLLRTRGEIDDSSEAPPHTAPQCSLHARGNAVLCWMYLLSVGPIAGWAARDLLCATCLAGAVGQGSEPLAAREGPAARGAAAGPRLSGRARGQGRERGGRAAEPGVLRVAAKQYWDFKGCTARGNPPPGQVQLSALAPAKGSDYLPYAVSRPWGAPCLHHTLPACLMFPPEACSCPPLGSCPSTFRQPHGSPSGMPHDPPPL